MDNNVLATILGVIAIPLGAVATGLSIVIGIVMSKWAAREKTKAALVEAQEKLKIMKINSDIAVQAVEQMYWDKPNEEKKILGLAIAKQLNTLAGIKLPDDIQLTSNEASVLNLPPTNIQGVG